MRALFLAAVLCCAIEAHAAEILRCDFEPVGAETQPIDWRFRQARGEGSGIWDPE
mgnify:CR=1 FL=1